MTDSGETLAHLYAKEILALADTIVVPRVTGMPWIYHEGVELRPDRELEILSVEVESPVGAVRPDVLIETPEGSMMIEVWVTSSIQESKMKKIEKIDLPVLEIDLRGVTDQSEVERIVLSSPDRKEWVFHPEINRFYKRVQEVVTPMPSIYHGVALHVMDCPEEMRDWKGKVYANLLDDCVYCVGCAGIEGDEGDEETLDEATEVVRCLGKDPMATLTRVASEVTQISRRSSD